MEILLWENAAESLLEDLLRQNCYGNIAVKTIVWQLCCGIPAGESLAEDSLPWKPYCGNFAVERFIDGSCVGSPAVETWLWKHCRSTRSTQGTPRRHPGTPRSPVRVSDGESATTYAFFNQSYATVYAIGNAGAKTF